MSDLSNYLEDKLFKHVLMNTAYTSPATVYLALFTAVSDAEAGTGTEVVGGSYARQPVVFSDNADGSGQNAAVEDFGPLAGSGTVTHAGIFDAVSGGNPLSIIKALTASKAWTAGDYIRFEIGEVDFAFQ